MGMTSVNSAHFRARSPNFPGNRKSQEFEVSNSGREGEIGYFPRRKVIPGLKAGLFPPNSSRLQLFPPASFTTFPNFRLKFRRAVMNALLYFE